MNNIHRGGHEVMLREDAMMRRRRHQEREMAAQLSHALKRSLELIPSRTEDYSASHRLLTSQH